MIPKQRMTSAIATISAICRPRLLSRYVKYSILICRPPAIASEVPRIVTSTIRTTEYSSVNANEMLVR